MLFKAISAFAVATAFTAGASAQLVEFDFVGNAGTGLLPGNEIGNPTPVSPGAAPSSATGGEILDGLIYNTQTNQLGFAFNFSGLSGGLLDAASGIHLHLADADDPFNTTGGIVFNLNSGTDANVTLENELITDFGTAAAGEIIGTATLTEAQEEQLFNSQFYLNIHSGTFGAGELRANLVAVPEPTTVALISLGALATLRRRRA